MEKTSNQPIATKLEYINSELIELANLVFDIYEELNNSLKT